MLFFAETMKRPRWCALLLLVFITLTPVWTLRVRNRSDPSQSSTGPPIKYRRRARVPRYGEFTSTPNEQFQKSQTTEPKTDNVHAPTVSDIDKPKKTANQVDNDDSAYQRRRKFPPSLRRTFRQPKESVNKEIVYTEKPKKIKKSRRRKIKRPSKNPPPQALPIIAAPSSLEEDLGTPEKAQNKTSGDKNLALEIGSEDGKYALIDKFFKEPLQQAPGVLSYHPSDEFQKDNSNTLGNVPQSDVWLSEGHLLVLKGSGFNDKLKDKWRPIDDYDRGNQAPLRIPIDTKNPPPFPLFLNDSGPPVFIGPPPPFGLPYPPPGLGNETFDPSRFPPPGMIPLYPNGTIPEFFGPPPGNHSFSPFPYPPPPPEYGNGSLPQYPPPPFPPGRYNDTYPPPPPFYPFPPPGGPHNGSRPGPFPPFFGPPPGNFSGGPPPPGFPLLPPLVLNPADNETDDPSIFLPPPYDFDYHEHNNDREVVPPGPFAPGLVVPPPKDFYTVYNKTQKNPPSYITKHTSEAPPPFSQRPNGKKPNFPMTTSSPFMPYMPGTTPAFNLEKPNKKRKRPKPYKRVYNFGQALSKFKHPSSSSSSEEVTGVPHIPSYHRQTIVSQPRPAQHDQRFHHQEEQLINRLPVTTPNTIIVTTSVRTTTTQKPQNYVYVRGQLKSVAELGAKEEEERNFYRGKPTPKPPYDERGYPTRVLDDEHPNTISPIVHSTISPVTYHTTPRPVKTYYYSTPKYGLTPKYSPVPKFSPTPKYTTPYEKSSKNFKLHRPNIENYNSYNNNPNQYLYSTVTPSPSPIIPYRNPVVGYNNNNNNYDPHQYSTSKPVTTQLSTVAPNYYSNSDEGINLSIRPRKNKKKRPRRPKILQLQSPREPHRVTSNELYSPLPVYEDTYQQNPGYGKNFVNNYLGNAHTEQQLSSPFRPAFGPIQPPRNNVQNPYSTTVAPNYNANSVYNSANAVGNGIYPAIQPQQHQSGYYSPISKYHVPVVNSHDQNNGYYSSHGTVLPHGTIPTTNANFQSSVQPYYFSQQQQPQQQQVRNPQSQHTVSGDPYTSQYLQPYYLRGSSGPLQQDLFVNYRSVLMILHLMAYSD